MARQLQMEEDQVFGGEHHSGRAVDVTTEGARAFELEFERTPAFEWLRENAGRFGFRLSFPEGNPCGYAYEPWHFRWVGKIVAKQVAASGMPRRPTGK